MIIPPSNDNFNPVFRFKINETALQFNIKYGIMAYFCECDYYMMIEENDNWIIQTI